MALRLCWTRSVQSWGDHMLSCTKICLGACTGTVCMLPQLLEGFKKLNEAAIVNLKQLQDARLLCKLQNVCGLWQCVKDVVGA